jgi:hypothetical protein
MFVWRYLDENEESVGTSSAFETQEAAEAWLGREWEALLQRGVDEVMLIDESTDARIYRMGLGPETD